MVIYCFHIFLLFSFANTFLITHTLICTYLLNVQETRILWAKTPSEHRKTYLRVNHDAKMMISAYIHATKNIDIHAWYNDTILSSCCYYIDDDDDDDEDIYIICIEKKNFENFIRFHKVRNKYLTNVFRRKAHTGKKAIKS